jgi:hypothetical protein
MNPAPDPALSISGYQDAKLKLLLIFGIFLTVGTFTSDFKEHK